MLVGFTTASRVLVEQGGTSLNTITPSLATVSRYQDLHFFSSQASVTVRRFPRVDLRQTGHVSHSWPGIKFNTITPSLATVFCPKTSISSPDAIEVLPKVHATRGREVLEDEVVTPMGWDRWMIDIAATRIGWPLWDGRMCLRDARHKTAPTPLITPARALKFRVAFPSVTVVNPDRDLHAGGSWPRLPEQTYCQWGLRDAAVQHHCLGQPAPQ
ncbi:uncharacterized protein BO72DRAFT_497573 [Aspergillus fijiensis CBS 313.89]|uniref:Uncharacterized protein n=1 Tax=Aspergillus fijiensis CBS 313.89 TaxID=1448319 RepID=A0A8G1VY18_9EURO|nr:uncharacterized protein BO72DRAFT_497573 [Aspergillus fijiensis CBS 313.89]RAK75841.1 hypothetical protein BO72DRAFT_497573 [Aspergillus fijiensis CBS 313.89]